MSTIESASSARTAPAPAGGAGAAVSRVACSACDAASAADARRTRVWPAGIAAALAWTLLAAVTQLWPNRVVGFTDWAYTDTFATAAGAFAVLLFVAATLGPLVPAVRAPLARV